MSVQTIIGPSFLGLIVVGLLATAAPTATAGPCDATAVSVAGGYLEARDGGDYWRAQRYLSPSFGQHLRERTGVPYLEYVSEPGRSWRASRIEATTGTAGQCTAQVSATRESDSGATSVVETYTLVLTPRGWRIDAWEWQPDE